MNPDPSDKRLQECFVAMRREDVAQTPLFGRSIRAPDAATLRPAAWVRMAAAAAGIAIAVGLTLVLVRPRVPEADLGDWSALSQWHSTTDTLLTMSENPWTGTVTMPTDTWFAPTASCDDTSETNTKKGEVL